MLDFVDLLQLYHAATYLTHFKVVFNHLVISSLLMLNMFCFLFAGLLFCDCQINIHKCVLFSLCRCTCLSDVFVYFLYQKNYGEPEQTEIIFIAVCFFVYSNRFLNSSDPKVCLFFIVFP